MITIYKYPFAIQDYVSLQLLRSAKILKVEYQEGIPCLWAAVNTDQPLVENKFRIFGTGHEIPRYIGGHVATFQQKTFVWHMFEDAEQNANGDRR